MTALLVVLVAFSTYRLTRLVVTDEITRPIRERLGNPYFLDCPWCVSMWLSVPVAWIGLVHRDQQAVQIIGLALSASAATGLISSVEPA